MRKTDSLTEKHKGSRIPQQVWLKIAGGAFKVVLSNILNEFSFKILHNV